MRVRNDGMRMVVFAVVCMVGTSFGQWTRGSTGGHVRLQYNTDSVGIGIQAPTVKFQVRDTTTGAGPKVVFLGSTTGTSCLPVIQLSNSKTRSVLGLMTGDIAVDTTGRVGIGTTTPYPGCGLEIMNSYPGVLDSCPLVVHNNSSTNGTAVAIGFEAVSGNTITGKITNVRVASGDYRTDFYNYTGTSLQNAMSIYKGCLAIGTTTPGTSYKLVVEGKLGAREVVVTKAAWADYVFKDGYNLKPLDKVEEYVKTHKHLEGIPTQTEVNKNGVAVGEMQAKLLQKVEELTLYTIAMKKENDELKTKVEALEKKVGR